MCQRLTVPKKLNLRIKSILTFFPRKFIPLKYTRYTDIYACAVLKFLSHFEEHNFIAYALICVYMYRITQNFQ